MLDPLTALALAGNIVQFVEFSGKIISGSSELFQSSTGVLNSNEALEAITKGLVAMTSKLGQLDLDDQSHLVSEEEQALQDLCRSCTSVADELLLRLNKLKVPTSIGQGKRKRWKSAQHAVQSVWAEKELSTLGGRLAGFKQALELRIVAQLRDQIDVLSLQLSDRFNELDGKCQAAILDLLTNREASEKQLQDHTFAVSRLFE
ncbi:hypothetical protein V502_04977 [Pseudogymnoascus sp. VKM F-4520 (FW-2644)]|nr:hypothetical protein V502_04977 [Pseudogymnoascus sp. VKM F-4520 (FW-2644)]